MEIIITILAAKTQHFHDKIQSIRLIFKDPITHNHQLMLTRLENQLTLNDIEQCFDEHYSQISDEDELSRNLTLLLAKRWEKIRHSFASYTQQPLNLVNQLCLALATALAPLPETEEEIDDLNPGEGPYFLLMPSLKAHQDAYGSNIHNLAMNQFVLSDDQRLFIPLEACLYRAFDSDAGHFAHVVSIDNHYPELSPNELLRVSKHSTLINQYYLAIMAFNNQRLFANGLGPHLNALTIALRAGGARAQGQETDSGATANEGIVRFSSYWDSLTPAQQQANYQAHTGLEIALGRLMRPNHSDYTNTIYCVEMIAQTLEPMIRACNRYETRTVELREQVNDKKILLSLRPKIEHYPSSWLTETKPLKIWEAFFALPEKSQQKLFQPIAYQSVLHFVLENDPLALPEYVHLLDQKSKKSAANVKFQHNDSALIIAAHQCGGSMAIEILLGLGAEINAVNYSRNTALDTAILRGHEAVVNTLLNNGAQIKASINYAGNTNTLTAAIEKYPTGEIFLLLLCKAITYDLKEQKALLRNIQNGIYENILIFVAERYPAQLNQLLERTKTQIARHSQHQAIINSQNSQGDTALILAAKAGSDVATLILLKLGADRNARSSNGNTILHWAAKNGHINIVSLLLEHDEPSEKLNTNGDTALHLAIQAGHTAVVNALLEKSFDITKRNTLGENAIDLAKSSPPELILILLVKAITLNARVQNEWLRKASNGIHGNALMYAANDSPSLFNQLLKVIVDNELSLADNIINSRNGLFETPLIVAAKTGNFDATNYLLDLGAEIDACNHNNRTALHTAAYNGHDNVVTILLACNALIEAKDNYGNTALNLAVQNGHPDVLNTLLALAANINCRNYGGENALDIATSSNPELINFLLLNAILLTLDEQREFLLEQEEGRYHSIITYVANKRVDLLEPLLEAMQHNNILCPSDILNSINTAGKTPLILAAQAGKALAIQIFIQLGARVDMVDNHGNTALHQAIKQGYGNVIDVLLATDNNTICHRNHQNENAIDLAIRLHPDLDVPELDAKLIAKAITLPLRQQKEFLQNVSGGIYESILTYAATKQCYTVPHLLILCQKDQHDYQTAKQQMKQYFDFDSHIQPIRDKLQEMERKENKNFAYHDAVAVAQRLITKLELAQNIYLLCDEESNKKKTIFKTSCINAITEARPVLETHREWGKVIAYFLLALITFPISLPLLAFGVFSLKTNSAQKLNVLESEVEKALLP